jgi:hypothetical protein
MPQSNKRTAGLPSPHPVGLQSTALLCQDLHPLVCTGPSTTLDPRTTKNPLLRPRQAPHLAGIPAPSSSLPLRPCWLPALWDDWIHAPPGSASLGARDALAPHRIPIPPGSPPLRTGHQFGMRQPHPPAHQDPHLSGGARPQLYRLTR